MRPKVLTGSHFMSGDEASAEGALSAGCNFFAGYPITPATEVAERMARRLPEVGGFYIQMEDEIASMAALLGASCAGMKSMSSTSGPGFSLMMENIGLGMMLEVPCVVINVQRGGPSTGLPTLVGQGDVMQVKWGSHGDYMPIAYTPNSSQEIFNLTIKAFNMAETYRTPVFVMSDEIIGHMVERVRIPEESEIKTVERKRPKEKPNKDFLPFKPGKDLVPPMPYAGEGYNVHFTGLTHDEKGYPVITEEAQQKYIPRLSQKITENAHKIIEYEEKEMDDAEVVIVAYGAVSRVAIRTMRPAREAGLKVRLFRLITLWPFPEEALKKVASNAKAFVVPEINLGQMVREVERVTKCPTYKVSHAGGGIHEPHKILKVVKEASK
jgi:2-oxoglutarate ferredoxin oxidoreductase subunit alpha